MPKISEIQKRLQVLSIDPGPIDGVYGRKTINALKIFQSKNNLVVDGIPGKKTLAALFPSQNVDLPAQQSVFRLDLVWLNEARRLLGVREKLGPGSNIIILDWANDLDIHYPDDEIPWCGLFVAHCLGSTLQDESLPTNPLLARSWKNFGVDAQPTPGAVMVFWRKSKEGVSGHVGFYVGEDENNYRILGGNQGDSVSIAWIAKNRYLTSRWPSCVNNPNAGSFICSRKESLSWDES
ncbi:NlpC/P60 family protein [Pantoea sp. A4]|uniref:NlpC/P60 family protein n=1 Tax=Pantoea sp. A4 TaxID=1225184 RepID=UPI000381F7ED|nr:TIGR02594 family protein [Pantoea sp. A4]